jgi:FkbM family methyltransferase
LRRAFLQSPEFEAKNPDLSLKLDKWVIVPTALGFKIFVALNEFGVSRPILLDRYEVSAVKLFQSLVRPGDRVIDVGANLGYHSLWLSTLVGASGMVLAFEPVKYLYTALTKSIAENQFEEQCLAFNCALSEHAGQGTIRHALGTLNFGGAHLVQAKQSDDHEYDVVEVKVLSDFIGDKRCSLIKLDVEGNEMKVLRGGVDLLRRDRPAVFVEISNEQLQRVSQCNGNDLLGFMARLGYRCFETSSGEAGAEITSYESNDLINVIFLSPT